MSSAFSTCLEKQEMVKKNFAAASNTEEKYHKLIEMGKKLKTLPKELETEDRLIKGCQSRAYLDASLKEGKVYFQGSADALISKGLISLLISVYNEESPETILRCEPSYILELGIQSSLTPGRANGLASMFQSMRQKAASFLEE